MTTFGTVHASGKYLSAINMVAYNNANNYRHPGRIIPATEDQGSTGEAFGQRVGTARRGGRASLTASEKERESQAPPNPFAMAGKA